MTVRPKSFPPPSAWPSRRAGTCRWPWRWPSSAAASSFWKWPPQGQLSEAAIQTRPRRRPEAGRWRVQRAVPRRLSAPDINGLQFVILTDIASDDADKGSTPNDYGDALTIDNFTATATNGNVNNAWNGYLPGHCPRQPGAG